MELNIKKIKYLRLKPEQKILFESYSTFKKYEDDEKIYFKDEINNIIVFLIDKKERLFFYDSQYHHVILSKLKIYFISILNFRSLIIDNLYNYFNININTYHSYPSKISL